MMYQKLIKNDIKKNKLITVTITGFIVFAALFTASVVSLFVNMMGAMENMMAEARTPHYIQMHKGDLDLARLERFAADHDEVEQVQAAEFLNIQGADIVVNGNSLTDSVQDNGVAVQNEMFDFLLDLDNQIIRPREGEIYVPVYYMLEGFAALGDQILIHDVPFRVAGFLRDSQMNSAMASSKRFLIHPADFEKLRDKGILEYLIGFRFNRDVDITEFGSAYLNAGLEDNGPTGSYALIKLINGITDGIMIAMLLLVSLLMLVIAFFCVRFTLIARVEEDYKEIGVLKAIGLRVWSIKKLYLAKYSVIAAVGCGLGFLLSLLVQEPMMKNIHLFMGRSDKEMLGKLMGLCGAAVIFGIVILYVNGILRRFKKLSATQAIRYGAPQDKAKGSKLFSLADNRLFSTDLFLAIKDVITRKTLYLIMLLVLVIACFIIVVPQNIINTVRHRSFMTYMGIGECDIRMDLHLVDNIPEQSRHIKQKLSADPDVERYSILTCYMFDMQMPDGSIGKLKVELGDHTKFPLTYAKGREPRDDNEISLSVINSRDLDKAIGDTIDLIVDGQKKTLTVCGIYSDITNGGMTAMAVFDGGSEKVMWSKFPIKLKNPANVNQKIAEYKAAYSDAKVSKIDDYIEQTIGPIERSAGIVSATGIGASAFLMVLITLLFMRMLITKDRYQIAVLKSMGFSSRSIQQQYMARVKVIMLLGMTLGTIAANTLGESVGLALMSTFGVSTFYFKVNVWFAYCISPILIAVCVGSAAWFGIGGIKTIKISEYIKE